MVRTLISRKRGRPRRRPPSPPPSPPPPSISISDVQIGEGEEWEIGEKVETNRSPENASIGAIRAEFQKKSLFDSPEKGHPSPDIKSWVDLFAFNRKPDEGLRLTHRPTEGEVLVIEGHQLSSITQQLGFCALGCFTGREPALNLAKELKEKKGWNCRLYPKEKGWILISFKDAASRDQAVNEGPYFIKGRTMILKEVEDNCILNKDIYHSRPIWIQIHGLPIVCWNEEVLSLITSRIGKPYCTDKITKSLQRMEYARALVEVPLTDKSIKEINIMLPTGALTINIQYEDSPLLCFFCSNIGHIKEECKRRTGKKVWSVKQDNRPNVQNTSTIDKDDAKADRGKSEQGQQPVEQCAITESEPPDLQIAAACSREQPAEQCTALPLPTDSTALQISATPSEIFPTANAATCSNRGVHPAELCAPLAKDSAALQITASPSKNSPTALLVIDNPTFNLLPVIDEEGFQRVENRKKSPRIMEQRPMREAKHKALSKFGSTSSKRSDNENRTLEHKRF